MKYKYIEENSFAYCISKMCHSFKVSSSGYYSWLKRPICKTKKNNEILLFLIKQSFKKSRNLYGSPRITADLKYSGIISGENRVAKLMKSNNIRSLIKKKFRSHKSKIQGIAPVPNLLTQDSIIDSINKAWVTDITYITTGEGWLYLASVMDLYSRKIIGWHISNRMTVDLVITALLRAIGRRKSTKGIIHHSDKGSQYTSHAYQNLLKENGFISSMCGKGNCFDNAVIESFHHSLKTELVYLENFETREEARRKLFDYIEVFYNTERIHSSLENMSPVVFENMKKAA